jgi:hypothetical protein
MENGRKTGDKKAKSLYKLKIQASNQLKILMTAAGNTLCTSRIVIICLQ